MQIKIGGVYRDVNGDRIGPMSAWRNACGDHVYQWTTEDGAPSEDQIYRANGTSRYNPALVAEWTDGPVVTETVTKTRIVPGVYDWVTVGESAEPAWARVSMEGALLDADQLDAAAAVLSALAKGLRDA